MPYDNIGSSAKVTLRTQPSGEINTNPTRANDYAELDDLYEALQETLRKFHLTSSFKSSTLEGDPATGTFTIKVKH